MKRLLVIASCSAALILPVLLLAASAARTERDQALRSIADPVRGALIFETCAACHGADGHGTSDGRIPVIAGQHFGVIVKQLVDFRHARRWDVAMEHFADSHHLTDPQAIADVAAHIAGLRPSAMSGSGDGEWVGHGAKVYFRRCESCHGPVGEGDAERDIPRLSGQHVAYLMRQMYYSAEGWRPNLPRDHTHFLVDLERADIEGIAAYLSRLTPQN